MIKGEFTFNLTDALCPRNTLPQYSTAYCATNEPILQWLKLTPVKRQPRVLTVAASGDQPLLYAAAGARHIDTFDITINACVAMDFKTAALQHMDFSDYQSASYVLRHLDNTDTFTSPKHKRFINQYFMRTVNSMPDRTRTLIKRLVKHRVQAFKDECPIPFPGNKQIYSLLKRAAPAPFNFIWADLMNVPNYIESEYDIINISNILDHYLWHHRPIEDMYNTFRNLWPHLSDGGYIICTTANFQTIDIFKHLPQEMPDANMDITFFEMPGCPFQPIVIQKTR